MRIALDPIFQQANGGNLGRACIDLPEFLLTAAGKDHPFLIALYVYLHRCWAGRDAAAPVERTAGRLIAEAGLWVSPTGRYRALEALKGDLNLLAERGWLGSWRIERGPLRDGLEDRYTLKPPRSGARNDTGGGNPETATFADTG